MIGTVRRSPLFGLILFGLGFAVASMLAGSGSGSAATGFAAGLFFLPFLVLKFFLFMALFGLAARFLFGFGHRGPWGHWSGHPGRPHHDHDHDRHDHDDRRPGPSGGGRGRGGSRGWGRPGPGREGAEWRYRGRPFPPASTRRPEEAEWEEHLRQARREVDDLDAPYRHADPSTPDPADPADPGSTTDTAPGDQTGDDMPDEPTDRSV